MAVTILHSPPIEHEDGLARAFAPAMTVCGPHETAVELLAVLASTARDLIHRGCGVDPAVLLAGEELDRVTLKVASWDPNCSAVLTTRELVKRGHRDEPLFYRGRCWLLVPRDMRTRLEEMCVPAWAAGSDLWPLFAARKIDLGVVAAMLGNYGKSDTSVGSKVMLIIDELIDHAPTQYERGLLKALKTILRFNLDTDKMRWTVRPTKTGLRVSAWWPDGSRLVALNANRGISWTVLGDAMLWVNHNGKRYGFTGTPIWWVTQDAFFNAQRRALATRFDARLRSLRQA